MLALIEELLHGARSDSNWATVVANFKHDAASFQRSWLSKVTRDRGVIRKHAVQLASQREILHVEGGLLAFAQLHHVLVQ